MNVVVWGTTCVFFSLVIDERDRQGDKRAALEGGLSLFYNAVLETASRGTLLPGTEGVTPTLTTMRAPGIYCGPPACLVVIRIACRNYCELLRISKPFPAA